MLTPSHCRLRTAAVQHMTSLVRIPDLQLLADQQDRAMGQLLQAQPHHLACRPLSGLSTECNTTSGISQHSGCSCSWGVTHVLQSKGISSRAYAGQQMVAAETALAATVAATPAVNPAASWRAKSMTRSGQDNQQEHLHRAGGWRIEACCCSLALIVLVHVLELINVLSAVQISPVLMLNAEGQQYPIVYFEDFWLLRDKLISLNETVTEVPLHMTIKSQKFWWMQIQQQVSCIGVHLELQRSKEACWLD